MVGQAVKATGEHTRQLAHFAATLTYERLPQEVVTLLKRLVLDTLGTALAANTLGAGCREIVSVAQRVGGASESTILGFGDRVSALMAAFTNGGMAHALNYDAIGGGHSGVVALASPLAAAERAGKVSGKEFLAAAAAATELTARLAAALAEAGTDANKTALEGQVLGYFGSAVGAGRVFRLSPQQMLSCLGLALMQAAGTMQVVVEGDPPAKAIYGAFPNYGGMLSALLAEEGLGCECSALEGEAGLYALYYNGRYHPSPLTDGLGSKFYTLNVRFKPWPTSGVVHPYIEAALTLVKEHCLSPASIDRIHFRVSAQTRAWAEPAEERRTPPNAAAAANSIFFGIAKALTNGKVTLADFTPEDLRQPEAMRLAERTDYSIEPSLGRAGIVEVVTTTGQRYTSRVDQPLGQGSRPLSQADLVEKFQDCVRYAAHPLTKEAVEEVVRTVDRLEGLPDVGVLAQLVSSRAESRQ